jgi:hypothetical protein
VGCEYHCSCLCSVEIESSGVSEHVLYSHVYVAWRLRVMEFLELVVYSHVYVAWRLRVMEFLEHFVYSHVPRNDFSLNDGPPI